MARRDGAGESQGCTGTVGGLWGVSNMLVCISGGPLRISEGWNVSSGRAGRHGQGWGRMGGRQEA